MTRRRQLRFTVGLAVAGRQLFAASFGRKFYGAAAAARGSPVTGRMRSPPYPAAAPAGTTAWLTRLRRVRREPCECHSQRAGTPRIVRAGPSSVKGT